MLIPVIEIIQPFKKRNALNRNFTVFEEILNRLRWSFFHKVDKRIYSRTNTTVSFVGNPSTNTVPCNDRGIAFLQIFDGGKNHLHFRLLMSSEVTI